jgi:nucleoside-diphosphate-sugar epimerase
MRVFIAGATGVLGRGLIRQFRTRGHEVVGLARRPEGEEIVRALGGQPRHADLYNADELARAAEGSDVVIHAATAIPLTTRPRPVDWANNDRVRREGTEALSQTAARIGARLYLQQSITWVARPPDGAPFDEDSPPRPDAMTQSALDGERIALEAGRQTCLVVGVLRCGWFYGPDSPHTRMMADGLRKRSLPIIGDGEAVWSCLHTDAAAGAFVDAAEAGRGGRWHVVDDRPATAKEFLTAFAHRLGALPPRRAPEWLVRLIAGRYAVEFLTASTRTSNARIRQDLGWSPRYATFEEGLDQVMTRWREQGEGQG